MPTYKEQLLNPRWQKKRLEIMKRDKFSCKICKDQETTLHIHHKIYKNNLSPWEYENSELVTLCEHCHLEVTDIMKENQSVNFNDIKIYKSSNWKGGSRIMFIICPNKTYMRIYDDNGDFLIGYKLGSELQNIIKILQLGLKSYKGK